MTISASGSGVGHTPGPWTFTEDYEGVADRTAIFNSETLKGVAWVGIGRTTPLEERSERGANARLISAAPDLLEYAKLEHEWRSIEGNAMYVADFMNRHGIRNQTVGFWLEGIRTAAISKATGAKP